MNTDNIILPDDDNEMPSGHETQKGYPMAETEGWENPENESTQPESASSGLLVVQVFTASGAFPVEGALVTISDNEKGLISVLETDRGGKTPPVRLATPPMSESLQPGKTPYSLYNIDTEAPGYYGVRNIGAAVFPDRTSIQRIEMIPIGEQLGQRNSKTLIFNESIPPKK